jgi:hypothetical protein
MPAVGSKPLCRSEMMVDVAACHCDRHEPATGAVAQGRRGHPAGTSLAVVVPAPHSSAAHAADRWMPASAGMTVTGG